MGVFEEKRLPPCGNVEMEPKVMEVFTMGCPKMEPGIEGGFPKREPAPTEVAPNADAPFDN